MDYYRDRGKCEFRNCDCTIHIWRRGTEQCYICNHGSCWHKKINKTRIKTIDKMSSKNYPDSLKYCINIESLPV